MELTGFEDALAASDVGLTGEGLIDVQTAYGKTAMGVAQRAHDTGVRCICFGGGATPEGIAALAKIGAIVVPLIEAPMSVDEAMAAGAAPLARAAERAARLVGCSAYVPEGQSDEIPFEMNNFRSYGDFLAARSALRGVPGRGSMHGCA